MLIIWQIFSAVGYMPFGSCKLRKLGITGKLKRFKKYIWSEMERMAFLARDLRRRTGKHIQGVGVGDFSGFSVMEQGCVKCKLFNCYTQILLPCFVKSCFSYHF